MSEATLAPALGNGNPTHVSNGTALSATSTDININNVTQFSTFTCFPSLPVELRLTIWSLALPFNRIVEILHKCHHPDIYWIPDLEPLRQRGQGLPEQRRFLSRNIDPLLLQVSHESRASALSIYKLTNFPHFQHPIYFNPSTDFVLMHDSIILSSFCITPNGQPSLRGSLKFLAIAPHGNMITSTNSMGRQTAPYFGSPQQPREILCSAVKQIGTLLEVIIFLEVGDKCGQDEAAVLDKLLKETMAEDTKTLKDKSWRTEKELESLCWEIPKISVIRKYSSSYRR